MMEGDLALPLVSREQFGSFLVTKTFTQQMGRERERPEHRMECCEERWTLARKREAEEMRRMKC
jgi:hypothetical protein